MSTSASSEKWLIRPSNKSFMRGSVTLQRRAASASTQPLLLTSADKARANWARARKLTASSQVSAKASKTLLKV